MSESFETPILFLIFNRPLETAAIWDRLREIKPKNLYIAADGPRPKTTKTSYLVPPPERL
ncbi:MAG: hypothetical protein Q8Q67_02530 [bacterium]|nr:hypothetical protein [bacterium]